MSWNTGQNKSLKPASTKIAVGAPMAYDPGVVGKPYKDEWDVERAYSEGIAKVTWAMRCVDAIAGNQAKLPIILTKNDSLDGQIVKNNPLLKILNSRPNIGEDSFNFRYRLSAQLLISTRGAFIEVIRSRGGDIDAVHLLPPQSTAPIPDKKKFVAGYEVQMPDGRKEILAPDKVVWIRKPHPLDPYKSYTPLEAAGIAIEIEILAKLYNRNFLINDGRPGGLLVINGEMNDEDKEELRTRFRGNIGSTGSVSVIASEEGASFIDLGSNPRDAAYIQMRMITKEEILASFGVPESIIGNASGRTYSNAAEEGKVFWMETMDPHLQLLARPLDALTENHYVHFDTSSVPILILAKQERERFYMEETRSGYISANEYREYTGRKKVKSELADALLVNPNLTPIGNTEKEMKTEPEQGPKMPLDVLTGETPTMSPEQQQQFGQQGQQAGQPATPQEGGGGLEAGQPIAAQGEGMSNISGERAPSEAPQQLSEEVPIEIKMENLIVKTPNEVWLEKSAKKIAQWEDVLDRTLTRFFERQERVILEKANSKKVRKMLEEGDLPNVDAIFDQEVWNKQMAEDLLPVLTGIVMDAAEGVSEKAETRISLDSSESVAAFVGEQIERAKLANSSTKDEVAGALLTAYTLDGDEDDGAAATKMALLVMAIKAVFVNVFTKRKERIVENEALTAYNAGTYFSAKEAKVGQKTWLTMMDDRVRPEHRELHGKSVELGEGFSLGDAVLRFPKDPLAPPHLTMGCRCVLAFS